MSESCNNNCSSCGENCNQRNAKQSFLKQPHEGSKIKKVIAVVSGKGGVGKSSVTSLLAVAAQNAGKQTAILDADITGPSIPKAFSIHEKAQSDGNAIYPAYSEKGIQIMSTNMMLDDETDPVIWRGPIIAGVVEQFWTDVLWQDVDVMLIDMPPGTGDVPLTVFQSLPVDGIIVVTSPQQLVSMIVNKAVKMSEKMDIPILGIVENMSYFVCDECGKKHKIFGEGNVEAIAQEYGIDRIAKLPIEPILAEQFDAGLIETVDCESLNIISKEFKDIFE